MQGSAIRHTGLQVSSDAWRVKKRPQAECIDAEHYEECIDFDDQSSSWILANIYVSHHQV